MIGSKAQHGQCNQPVQLPSVEAPDVPEPELLYSDEDEQDQGPLAVTDALTTIYKDCERVHGGRESTVLCQAGP